MIVNVYLQGKHGDERIVIVPFDVKFSHSMVSKNRSLWVLHRKPTTINSIQTIHSIRADLDGKKRMREEDAILSKSSALCVSETNLHFNLIPCHSIRNTPLSLVDWWFYYIRQGITYIGKHVSKIYTRLYVVTLTFKGGMSKYQHNYRIP